MVTPSKGVLHHGPPKAAPRGGIAIPRALRAVGLEQLLRSEGLGLELHRTGVLHSWNCQTLRVPRQSRGFTHEN